MAASWKDYSFSVGGALIPNWPLLYGKVHSDLVAWIEAANQQTPDQQLELVAGPWDSPDPCGWTLRAQLADTYPQNWSDERLRGQPVELISSWTFSAPTRFVHGYGLAAAWAAPVEGGSVHGVLGGQGWSTVTGAAYRNDNPVLALVVSSLTPGAEFLAIAHGEGVATSRMLMPLLISKDQVSAQWVLLAGVPSAYELLVGISWNRRAMRAVKVSGLATRGSAPIDTGRFRAPTRALPALQISSDATAVVQYDRALLPAELRSGSPGLGSWVLGPDGSGWLGIGGGLLACVQDRQVG